MSLLLFDLFFHIQVGNYIIVLSKRKRPSQPNDMSISLTKVPCQRPQPLDPVPLYDS